MGKQPFHESIKALEADIGHANTLALGYPRDKDGACFQMRLSFSPIFPFFLFLVQWTDYRLADALGLLRVLIYMTYEDGKNTIAIYERKASIKQFNSVIYPALLQLEKGISDLEERKQREISAVRYKRKESGSKIDMEREEECGICLEVMPKVVLPNCCHSMCLKCFRNWRARSKSCPFCRDNLQRVNSGDLWNYTDTCEIVDVRTVFKENRKRLLLYIEKLPILPTDPMYVSYELLCRR